VQHINTSAESLSGENAQTVRSWHVMLEGVVYIWAFEP